MIEELYDVFIQSTGVCTDTRYIKKGSVFFALKGGNFDGNQYARKALEEGSVFAIVDDESILSEDDSSSNILLVDDVLKTLQELATYHRLQLKAKVICIVGSNGKTTSKELLCAVLSKKYKVVATKGNLNNHIGVPLTLLSAKLDTEILIVEMGANHQREIKFLCELALPDFGTLINIGKAHLEGFGGIKGVRKGKTEMFQFFSENEASVFFNCNEPSIAEFGDLVFNPIKFGTGTNVDAETSKNSDKLNFSLKVNGDSVFVQTNLFGEYNLNNALTAAAIGNYFEVRITDVVEAISNYAPSNNRSEVTVTDKGNKVVLDAYNANPTSMRNAVIQFAKNANATSVCILGDMYELGEESETCHLAVLDLVCDFPGTSMMVGTEFLKLSKRFKNHPKIKFFENVHSLEKSKELYLVEKRGVLVKGSRGVALEKLLPLL